MLNPLRDKNEGMCRGGGGEGVTIRLSLGKLLLVNLLQVVKRTNTPL